MSVSAVPVKEIAEALLIRMSMPPNFCTAACTADLTWFSSLTSTMQAKPLPPAFSTENKFTRYDIIKSVDVVTNRSSNRK